jgi:hypothetical protein
VRVCEVPCVRTYDSDVCGTRALQSALEIGHFGHALGAIWRDSQHKPQKRREQNGQNAPVLRSNGGVFDIGLIFC